MLYPDERLRLCRARRLLCNPSLHGLPVRLVAREVGMSPHHFIRRFRTVFGVTPKQCQLDARIERAKQLLTLTDLPVTDVAFEVGFASLGSFSHLFARRTGASPSRYRARTRPWVERPGELPGRLVPGCFALMAAPPG